MKVQDVMKTDILTVRRSTSLRKLLSEFNKFHALPIIPVVDETNHLIGVVYLANLLEILKTHEAKFLRNIPFVEVDEDAFDLDPAPAMGELLLVDDIMDQNFVALRANMSLEEAYHQMRLHQKDQLPVVDEKNTLLGILGIFGIVLKMFKEKGIV